MHPVALEAGSKRLVLVMSLVAFETGRNSAMPLTVTILAGLPGMGTGEFLQLLRRLPMAIGAFSCQNQHRKASERGMGIFVTGKALRHFLAVGQTVTAPAYGHQCGKIVLARIVGMKNFVAIRAAKPMSSSLVFKSLEMNQMATATLGHRHRLGVDRIRAQDSVRQGTPAGRHCCLDCD